MMRVQLTSQEELGQTYWIKIVFKHSIKHVKYNVLWYKYLVINKILGTVGNQFDEYIAVDE